MTFRESDVNKAELCSEYYLSLDMILFLSRWQGNLACLLILKTRVLLSLLKCLRNLFIYTFALMTELLNKLIAAEERR